MASDTPSSPFWTFSLGYYRQPGVAAACLELQDRCGVDVNVLLFMLWSASQQRRLPDDQVQVLADKVRDWQADVVVPLRNLRRRLKSDAPVIDKASVELFRTKIKAIELEAERLQQEAMFALDLSSETSGPIIEAARANVAALQRVLGRPLAAAAIDTLIDALGPYTTTS